MVRNHQSVDWGNYFKSIRVECPWSYTSWQQGRIEIVEYSGELLPLGDWDARVYVCRVPNDTLEALAFSHNLGSDEWLFSYPGYGPYAAPVPVLIQQDRNRLRKLREKINYQPLDSD